MWILLYTTLSIIAPSFEVMPMPALPAAVRFRFPHQKLLKLLQVSEPNCVALFWVERMRLFDTNVLSLLPLVQRAESPFITMASSLPSMSESSMTAFELLMRLKASRLWLSRILMCETLRLEAPLARMAKCPPSVNVMPVMVICEAFLRERILSPWPVPGVPVTRAPLP